MRTPLKEVYDILNMFKSQEVVFSDVELPNSFCKIGVIQASIALKKDFPIYTEIENINGVDTEVFYIEGISQKEVYLAGVYSYRNLAIQTHDDLKRKAINFKTISFAVSGLTERAKEVMRTVWWCDNEIERILKALFGSSSSGYAVEMGDSND